MRGRLSAPFLAGLVVCALALTAAVTWALDPGSVGVVRSVPAGTTGFDGAPVPTEQVEVVHCPAFGSTFGPQRQAQFDPANPLDEHAFAPPADPSFVAQADAKCQNQRSEHVRAALILAMIAVGASAVVGALLLVGRRRPVPDEADYAGARLADPAPSRARARDAEPAGAVAGDGGETARCPRCAGPTKMSSPLDPAFGVAAPSLCPGCRERAIGIREAWLLIGSSVLVVTGLVLWLDGDVELAAVLVAVGAVVPLLFLQSWPHELGHVAAAKLLGFDVLGLTVGNGPLLWRRTIGGVEVEAKALPASGLTVATLRSSRAYRLRMAAFVAAGPAVSVAILALALRWSPTGGPIATSLRGAVIGSALIVLVTNLLPYRTTGPSGPRRTDGYLLLTIPFFAAPKIAKFVARNKLEYALAQARHGKGLRLDDESRAQLRERAEGTGHPVWQVVLLMDAMVRVDWSDQQDAARALLRGSDLVGQPEWMLQNCLAWAGIMLGASTDARSEVAVASERAFVLQPDDAGVQGTSGTVLIELGQYEQGLARLRASVAATDVAEHKATNLSYVVIGLLGLGDLAGARDAMTEAEALDPDCDLLPRARERLAAASEAASGAALNRR